MTGSGGNRCNLSAVIYLFFSKRVPKNLLQQTHDDIIMRISLAGFVTICRKETKNSIVYTEHNTWIRYTYSPRMGQPSTSNTRCGHKQFQWSGNFQQRILLKSPKEEDWKWRWFRMGWIRKYFRRTVRDKKSASVPLIMKEMKRKEKEKRNGEEEREYENGKMENKRWRKNPNGGSQSSQSPNLSNIQISQSPESPQSHLRSPISQSLNLRSTIIRISPNLPISQSPNSQSPISQSPNSEPPISNLSIPNLPILSLQLQSLHLPISPSPNLPILQSLNLPISNPPSPNLKSQWYSRGAK